MGTANRALIQACEHARRALDYLSKLVDESQAACPHPKEALGETIVVNRKTHQQRRAIYCRRCSKLIR